MKKLLLLLLIVFIPCYVAAQEPPPPAEGNFSQSLGLVLPDNLEQNADLDFSFLIDEIATPTTLVVNDQYTLEKINNEFWYVIVLACLSVVSILIVLYFLKMRTDSTSSDIVHAAGLPLIVFGTIILVLIVDTSEQLTAAIGIMGAIAGYLFRSVQETGKGSGVDQEL